MVKLLHVEGFENLQKASKENEGKTMFVLFFGSKGADGKSWCPDCVKADPIVHEQSKYAPEDSLFIECGVGDRSFWKDQTNIFRTKLGIKCVPTLLKWGSKGRKLEEGQCADKGLVRMMFED
jgi:thiol-disulfide isomerase/thioredoxin